MAVKEIEILMKKIWENSSCLNCISNLVFLTESISDCLVKQDNEAGMFANATSALSY